MKKDVIFLLISVFIIINAVIITAAVTDVNNDGVTDRKDISDLAPYYRGVYNSDFDVNSDGVVDLFDIVIIAKNVTLSDVSWPDNEPAGLSPVYSGQPSSQPAGTVLDGSDVFFDYTSQGGSDIGSNFFIGQKWDGGPRILKTTSLGSKYPNVIRKNMLIGDVAGWNGIASDAEFPDDYEELYFRFIFKYSANWQFNPGSDKYWYWGGTGEGGTDFYISVSGMNVIAVRNQGSYGGDIGEWRSGTVVSRDEWHTLELSIVSQSALGVADGSFKVWYDDVEITNSFNWLGGGEDPGQTAIEWYGSGHHTRLFSGIEMFLYWGGGSGTKTVNDYLDISEFYITGKTAVV